MLYESTRLLRFVKRLCITGLLVNGCGQRLDSQQPGDPSLQPMERIDGLITADDSPPEVHRRGSASKPLRGGGLAVSRDGRRVLVSDLDGDRLLLVDLESSQLVRTVALEPGSGPGQVVEDESGNFQVLQRDRGRIQTLTADGQPVRQRSVCAEPRGLALQPGGFLWLACASGDLVQLRADNLSVQNVLATGTNDLRDVVWANDKLLISRFRSATVLTVGLDGKVSALQRPPQYIGTDLRHTIYDPHVGWRMLGMPGGRALMIYQMHSLLPLPYYGAPLPILPFATVVDPAKQLEVGAQLTDAVLPVDAALSGDQKTLAIVAAGNISVSAGTVTIPAAHGAPLLFVSAQSLSGNPLASIKAQYVPGKAAPQFKPSAVVARGDSTFVVKTYDPLALSLFTADGTLLSSIPLEPAGSKAPDVAQQLFHAGTSSGMACASCHPEGGEDGHLWSIGKSLGINNGPPHRTQSLLGTLPGKKSFHWDGAFTDLAALFENDAARVGFRVAPQQLSMIAAELSKWLLAQPAPWSPALWRSQQASVRRGQELFAGASGYGCASCHSGPRFTSGSTVSIQSGTWVVPSLLGAGSRSPYLHSGATSDFEDLLSDPNDKTHLVPTLDRADLAAYLRTL